MTATAAETTQMARTPDSRPDPPAANETAAGSRVRTVLGGNPLQTVLATVAVALLVFVLTDNRSRVDRLEDTMNDRFAEQDAKIDEINLKLTALIATLNKTREVDAAIEGRLLDSEPAADDPGGVPR